MTALDNVTYILIEAYSAGSTDCRRSSPISGRRPSRNSLRNTTEIHIIPRNENTAVRNTAASTNTTNAIQKNAC